MYLTKLVQNLPWNARISSIQTTESPTPDSSAVNHHSLFGYQFALFLLCTLYATIGDSHETIATHTLIDGMCVAVNPVDDSTDEEIPVDAGVSAAPEVPTDLGIPEDLEIPADPEVPVDAPTEVEEPGSVEVPVEADSTVEPVIPTEPVIVSGLMSDSFTGDGPLEKYTTNNPSALPDVARKDGRYHAPVTDNEGNITLHYNSSQGRLDAKRLSFPFEFVARNIGIGTLADSQTAPSPDDFSTPSRLYMFAGIQVHVLDLDQPDSAHFVVGHRGSTSYTVEGKNTVNGSSKVNDAGQGILPTGRADLRVVGHADKSLSWYWQQPNSDPVAQTDDWIAYRGNGTFPGSQAVFGDEVFVGLVTYAYGRKNVPFVGTSDGIEWLENAP